MFELLVCMCLDHKTRYQNSHRGSRAQYTSSTYNLIISICIIMCWQTDLVRDQIWLLLMIIQLIGLLTCSSNHGLDGASIILGTCFLFYMLLFMLIFISSHLGSSMLSGYSIIDHGNRPLFSARSIQFAFATSNF